MFADDISYAKAPTFKVISTNEHCATIQSDTGLIFDGCLNHAGARVNYTGCPEAVIVQEVEIVVRSCDVTTKSAEGYEKIFNKLCSIEGLSSICRLHVSLFPKGKTISQNSNSVGRDGCPINSEFY